jgi:hypothetical protein
LSTHAIGPVRLLLGSLGLLLAGGVIVWLLAGGMARPAVLVIRDGSFEIESWAGDLRQSGTDLLWEHEVNDVELFVYRSQGDEEFELGEPIAVPGVRGMRIDFRVGAGLTLTGAVSLSMTDGAVRISVRDGRFTQKGDLWVHSGFVRDGRKARFEIARLEFLDRNNQVLSRYQNPDLGRRVRFRIKLLGGPGR